MADNTGRETVTVSAEWEIIPPDKPVIHFMASRVATATQDGLQYAWLRSASGIGLAMRISDAEGKVLAHWVLREEALMEKAAALALSRIKESE